MIQYMKVRPLDDELRVWNRKIEALAREMNLDFFETIFEVITYDKMNEIAAYGGFPVRYPHWRFGMEYERMSKSYAYGLSKIYELVINTDPTYAYLLEGNELVDQKMVMAHVFGHGDFFKNNYWFSQTNRKMLDVMANHATRIRRYQDHFGQTNVEEFIDVALSLENLIDLHAPYIKRKASRTEEERPTDLPDELVGDPDVPRLKAKEYMDDFINPEDYVKAQREKAKKEAEQPPRFPKEPQRDIMMFLMEHAPLTRWQRNVLGMIREEAYYFAPQGMTKIMNEGWACVRAGTYVFTDQGMVEMAHLVERGAGEVFDGEKRQQVYDRNIIPDHDTVTVTTRRGLELCGSNNHRVLLDDNETWKRLDELKVGDRIAISGGGDMWATEPVQIDWLPPESVTLHDVADEAGVSVWTVLRHRAGKSTRKAHSIEAALQAYDTAQTFASAKSLNRRGGVYIPGVLDEALGAFLGYLAGDGHISRRKRHLGLTTGDEPQARRFFELAESLFGVTPTQRLDGNRWRVLLHAETVSDFLTQGLGMTEGPSAHEKKVPDAVLRSPEPVVRAFLRALFDCDGYAGKQGVILSTVSDKMAEQVQLLLLNYGILNRRRRQKDGCWHVHVTGASAKTFAERIGFGLERKQTALEAYVSDRKWFKAERWFDEVVALTEGREDVYDISVTDTHRYAAGGLINHNSYWHSKMMTQHIMDDSEVIDFADRHAGTMAMRPGGINPYKVGIELFRHIEERWDKGQYGWDYDNCDDMAERANWDRKTGKGLEKIFEVRRHHNDITFLDEFLTPEFCAEQKMFTFAFNRKADEWQIASREFQQVKQKLLTQLTNMGNPFIEVYDANFENRSELLLRHRFEGVDLDENYARDTLANIYKVWKRPVHIASQRNDKGVLLSFDGEKPSERPFDKI
ncbi:MAG: SpoVR family protein [Bradymonadia bacterium]